MQSLAELGVALGVVAQSALVVFPLLAGACMQSIADLVILSSS